MSKRPSSKPAVWLPAMSVMQLKPGTIVRDRIYKNLTGSQVITQRGPRLIRFATGYETTVKAAKRYLEFKAAPQAH